MEWKKIVFDIYLDTLKDEIAKKWIYDGRSTFELRTVNSLVDKQYCIINFEKKLQLGD